MKRYQGVVLHPDRGGEKLVIVVHESGAMERLTHHVRHSPTGIEWGYGGSGPADLARSLLIDALGDKAHCPRCGGSGKDPEFPEEKCLDCFGERFGPIVERNYQRFKLEVISRLDRTHGWAMTQEQILEWLRKQGENV